MVHFRAGNQAQVWGTDSNIDNVLHHDYEVVLLYDLESFDNRASASVVDFNMLGIELSRDTLAQISADTADPVMDFPAGIVVNVTSSEGEMTLNLTTVSIVSH